MPRTPLYELNREVVLDWMEERALRLVDLQRLTVDVDDEAKGISLALLSELLSEGKRSGRPTRTHTSLRTIRLLALALEIRRPQSLVRSGEAAAQPEVIACKPAGRVFTVRLPGSGARR